MAFQWIGKSTDGKTVTLQKLESEHFKAPAYFNLEWESAHADLVRIGCVVDVETTGLQHKNDKIIELAIRQFKFNRATGEVLRFGDTYSEMQDPGVPISAEIQELTGITDAMVKGKKIDWARAHALFEQSQMIIAHNASFDRPFLDQSLPVSSAKVWACSLKQVDWNDKGFPSQKLEILGIYHGFFNDSHRALNDVDSLLYLLSLTDAHTQKPYFLELMENARKPTVHVVAAQSPFESKDHLRNRKYSWDANEKYWAKFVQKEELPAEIKWLEEVVYRGAFRGRSAEIQPVDHFKAKKD
jgi:DNA polymerase-3 subunit epsilon